MFVNRKGRVVEARVETSSGHPMLGRQMVKVKKLAGGNKRHLAALVEQALKDAFLWEEVKDRLADDAKSARRCKEFSSSAGEPQNNRRLPGNIVFDGETLGKRPSPKCPHMPHNRYIMRH